MFVLKGKRYLASLISAGEAFVFVLGLGLVIDNLGEIQNLIAYAAGFAIGILVGTKIEDYLALGYVTVKVISKQDQIPFTKELRNKGFGVTSWLGEGRDGKRLIMEILTTRKNQRLLYNYVISLDPEAFVISHEPQHFRGGFWVKSLRKYYKQHDEIFEQPFEEEYMPAGVDAQSIAEIKSTLDNDKKKES
jgi:uncharacterized protein YebE (UPF0316 family)